MGLIVRFFSFLLVLGIAGMFFIKKPDGTPWLAVEDFIPDTSSIKNTISDAIPEQIIGGGDSESVAVYKWRDNEGNWQYSDKPPEGIGAEQIFVGTDANKDLAPPPPPKITASPTNEKGRAIFIKDSGLSPTTVSPDKISTLIEDAKNVQTLVDDRQKQLESALQSGGK